jgi:DNA topoisomerase IB
MPKPMTEEEQARRRKKTTSVRKLAESMQGLRQKVTMDLKSDDPKTRLTALAVALMDNTAERVGNEDSAKDGHFGVTGFLKKHISVDGNKVSLKYTGKSGVDHEKQFSNKLVAKVLKECLDRCEGADSPVLVTEDGFQVNAAKVNRYLKDYDVTAKDIRGLAANSMISAMLKNREKPADEKERLKVFREVMKTVAEKVGHQQSTLKQHYLLPTFETEYVKKGKVPTVKEASTLDTMPIRLTVDRIARRVVAKVNSQTLESEAWAQVRLIKPHLETLAESLVGVNNYPDQLVIAVNEWDLPDGKIASYVFPGEQGNVGGLLTLAPRAFKTPVLMRNVLAHELIHAVLGEDYPNHGPEFQALADALQIPKEWQD